MAVAPEVEARIRRLVLANALEHGGSPRPGPILSRILATYPDLRSDTGAVGVAIGAAVGAAAKLTPAEQRSALDALGGPEPEAPRRPTSSTGEFPPLEGAVPGKVVLRLAPFPSGSLHIGNARMLFVNQYYQERYGGKLLLVFDDTAGSEQKRVDAELYDVIRHDIELAGVVPDAVYYKSDLIPNHYPWARRVIEQGAAYVCRCPVELLRENRKLGRACPERAQSLEQALEGWEAMLGGSLQPGEAVLRLKTDMADPDPAFRDRVLFRISDLDHPRVGHKFRVWPSLEFSWAVDDVELGVTHVLRGKDLVMEDRMEQYLWKLFGVTGPPFLHWGLLMVREAKISKSKSYQEVRSGLYDGWADPRTWSIGSLDRRGISRQALQRFTLSFGLSLADIQVPAETLYAENRSIIDPVTPRRAFVAEPVRVEVQGYPTGLDHVELPNHPEREELGRRSVAAGPAFFLARRDLLAHPGEEIRLKDLINLRLPTSVESTERVVAEFTSRENRRLPRVQWVGASEAVPVDLLQVDGSHTAGLGEGALGTATPGDLVQFERVGFARIERSWAPGATPVRACYGHP
ncbi:MAG: glutamate--tRNA ligase [Thermoplasmata archaeon]|nr:glutamate--tRNA ligase [Thermoplasmata archaeon]